MQRLLILAAIVLTATTLAAQTPAPSAPAAPVSPPTVLNGLSAFPIAVWLQDPRNAPKYKAIGINVFVGLWQGPTETQLTALQKAGMPVICDQNDEALKPKWQKEILGWLQNDEPDNAQALPNKAGYGPPILPAKVLERYHQMKKADPPPTDRPVILNLGQGVAWDGWYGRGTRTNKPEDYPEYVKAGDIVSFDIYPVVHDSKEVAGKLWYVARGVERLVKWTNETEAANGGAAKLGGTGKPVWACIECTHISNAKIKPTPDQVRSEVWMALIEGAHGLVYFAHQFAPKFIEAGLLDDPAMSQSVSQINREIQYFAPILLSPPIAKPATVESAPPDKVLPPAPAFPIALLTRQYAGATYVFAVSLRETPVKATINFAGAAGDIEVLAEKRTLPAAAYQWTDDFAPYQVHLYKIAPAATGTR